MDEFYVEPALLDMIDQPEPQPPASSQPRAGYRFVGGVEVPLRCPLCHWLVVAENQSKAYVRARCTSGTGCTWAKRYAR